MAEESSRALGGGPPLLASRLVPAVPPEPLLLRPRLLRRLDEGSGGPVTLVRAPAGWGKTTLLASWVRAAGTAATPATPAWLGVERGDTAERFWSYLTAALADVPADPVTGVPTDPLAGVPADGGSAPGRPEQLEPLAAALAARDRPVVLVLDDLHRVGTPEPLAGLEFLLRHGGRGLRLVIGARTDPALPLHRWRLSGELTEIGQDELAFTTDEVADLLTAHGVAVPPATVPLLRYRTAGWPAGLRFAALAAGRTDPARAVAEFTGDQTDVAAYLREEVLAELPGEDVELLRRTAVTEMLCGDLADALTGRSDGDRTLADLSRAGGFLHPDAPHPGWYRCHPLLADLLHTELTRLPGDELRELHRRAAGWHAGHGRPATALRHALAAGEWDRAVDLLVAEWPELLPYDPEPTGPPPAEPPAERIGREPELALALAVAHAGAGDPSAAAYLRHAAAEARSLPTPRRDRFLRLVAAVEVALAQLADDPDELRAAAARLRRTLVGPTAGSADDPRSTAGEETDVRLVAATADALADLADGDLAAAGPALDDAATRAGTAGRTRTALVCHGRAALVAAWRGALRDAERTARETLDGPAGHADAGHAHLALALVALHRDRPDEAGGHLTLADGPRYAPAVAAVADHCRAQLLRDRGDPDGARRLLAAARERLAGLPRAGTVTGWLLAAESELCATRGDLTAARDLLCAAEPAMADEALGVAQARLERHAGDPRAAGYALPAWDGPDAGNWPLPVRLDAGLLDALLAAEAGDGRRAGRLLERVLDLAEPDGHRRFLTRAGPAVRDLLAGHLDAGTAHWSFVSDLVRVAAERAGGDPATDGREPTRPPVEPDRGPVEPLTERELTILRYLQSILSNVEIAGELSLSVNTVKTHVRNIYRKLDATRRREAVRRARELHLI